MEQNKMEGRACPPQFAVPKNQEKLPFFVSGAEKLAALCSYPLAWLYVRGYALGGAHWKEGLAAFTLLFCLGVELFSRRMGRRKAPAESWFWLCCLAGIELSMMLWHGTTVLGWDILLLHGIAAYWVLCRTGALAGGRTGPMVLLDAADALLLLPFGNFFLRVRTLWQMLTGRRKNRQLGAVLLTLVIVVPLLLFAAGQLADADAGFGALLGQLLDRLDRVFTTAGLLHFVVSLPVGAWLYGLTAGALRRHGASPLADALRRESAQLRRVPVWPLALSAGAFCLLYLAFFTVQAGYLAGALRGRLPEGFTAADYARGGFWQLCRIVVLNFALLLAGAKLSRTPLRQNRLLKAMALALNGCNLLFAAVALCKMGIYIRLYGLTPSRVLATWFMLVLLVWIVLLTVTLLHPFAAVRAAVFAAAGLFTLLCLGNPDGLVIRTNLNLYRSGILRELDTDTLRICGAAEDVEDYARKLHRAGWYEGHTREEIVRELGEPGRTEPGRAYWSAGWNVIDPEVLVVEFDPRTQTASGAYLMEGMV